MAKNQKEPAKTKGTVIAEKLRAKANKLSDEEREQLIQKAREVMYGGGDHGKACAHRS